MSVSLSELYQIEKHVEDGFDGMLNSLAVTYKSRSKVDYQSARIELKCILGESLEHRKLFTGGDQTHDVWEAQIQLTAVTNRAESGNTDAHSTLLGNIRSRMTLRYAKHNFDSDVVEIMDIRDTGTLDNFRDEDNLDLTVLSYYLVVTIKPDAWPEN